VSSHQTYVLGGFLEGHTGTLQLKVFVMLMTQPCQTLIPATLKAQGEEPVRLVRSDQLDHGFGRSEGYSSAFWVLLGPHQRQTAERGSGPVAVFQ
jgi:hypothetical protein